MSRPRTPTATLEARGAFVRNPQRRGERANEPRDDRPLGPCPDHFTDEQAKCWAEFVERAAPGVLKLADAQLVELACVSLASLREPTLEIVTKAGVVVTIDKPFDSKAANALLRCLIEMGMTPVSRSKVQVTPPPADDESPRGFGALQ